MWVYRYAGGAQSRAAASGIKLVAKAKGSSQTLKQQSKPAKPSFTPEQLAEQERLKKLQQQAKEREAAAAAAKAAEAAAKEKDAQRKWILQYAEDDSESEPDDEPSKVCVVRLHCCMTTCTVLFEHRHCNTG